MTQLQNLQSLFEDSMDIRYPGWKDQFSPAKIIMLSCLFDDGVIGGIQMAGEKLEVLKKQIRI